jgi:hypothetical protein
MRSGFSVIRYSRLSAFFFCVLSLSTGLIASRFVARWSDDCHRSAHEALALRSAQCEMLRTSKMI